LERRGDLIRGTEQFWELVSNLAGDLMPGPEREIPRDLFTMLAFVWAIQAEKGVPHDPYALLRHVRDRAWQGYADTGRLAEVIQQELPRSQGAVRMARYFEEIAAKRSAYLFLPIVSRVDRHQAKQRPPERLELDALGEEWGRHAVRLSNAAGVCGRAGGHEPRTRRLLAGVDERRLGSGFPAHERPRGDRLGSRPAPPAVRAA
jgi:hypothetical protein